MLLIFIVCISLALQCVAQCLSNVVIVLNARDRYTPPTQPCFTDADCFDVSTFAGPFVPNQNANCSKDTFRCFLSDVNTGYSAQSGDWLTWSTSYVSTGFPSSKDGTITFDLAYPAFIRVDGVLQLWRLSSQEGLIGLFDYYNRSMYVGYGQALLPVTFSGVGVGTYVIVFWPSGGTRSGTGVPEYSPFVCVDSGFNRDYKFSLSLVPQMDTNCFNVNVSGAHNYPFTHITTPSRVSVAYQLVSSPPGFENAADALPAKGRILGFEYLTDLGNRIHAQVGPGTLEPAYFTCACCSTVSKYFFKFYPMQNGGRAYTPEGTFVQPAIRYYGRITNLQVRMLYVGEVPSTFSHYWNDRQEYGPGQVLAYKLFDINQQMVAGVLGMLNTLSPLPVSEGNNILGIRPDTDLLTVFWRNGYAGGPNFLAGCTAGTDCASCYDGHCYGSGVTAAQATVKYTGQSMGEYTGKLLQSEDFATVGEGAFVYEGRHTTFDFAFNPHTNQVPVRTDDYSCRPMGTPYANSHDVQYGTQSELAGYYPFADMILDDTIQRAFMPSGCQNNANCPTSNNLSPGVTQLGGGCPCCLDVVDVDSSVQARDKQQNYCQPTGGGGGAVQQIQHNFILGVSGNCPPDVMYSWAEHKTATIPYICNFDGRCTLNQWCPPNDCSNVYPSGRPCIRSCGANYQGWMMSSSNNANGVVNAAKLKMGAINCGSTGVDNVLDRMRVSRSTYFPQVCPSSVNWGGQYGPFYQGGQTNPTPGISLCISAACAPNPTDTCFRNGFDDPISYFFDLWDALSADSHGDMNYGARTYTSSLYGCKSLVKPLFLVDSAGGFNYCATGTKGAKCAGVGATCSPVAFDTNSDTSTLFFPYGRKYGSFGIDTQILTIQDQAGTAPDDNIRKFTTQTVTSYARFQVRPYAEFRDFTNATFEDGNVNPRLIVVKLRISCPLLEMGWLGDTDRSGNFFYPRQTAYCVDMWQIVNQDGCPLGVRVMGSDQPISYQQNVTSYGFSKSIPVTCANFSLTPMNTLMQIKTTAEVDVQIYWYPGDTVHLVYRQRMEPTEVPGPSYCEFASDESQIVYSGLSFILPPYWALQPMITQVRLAQPACMGDKPEALQRTFKGIPYAWEVTSALHLSDVIAQGVPTDFSRDVEYYEVTSATSGLQRGFAEQFQLYIPPMDFTVWDRQTSLTVLDAQIDKTRLSPYYPNPLLQNPRCNNNINYTENAECPINIDDNPNFSHIGQFQFCSTQTGKQEVLLYGVFVFVSTNYSLADSIGSYNFLELLEFIDPAITALQYTGRATQTACYQVPEPGFYMEVVTYGGKSIEGSQQPPCNQRFIAKVYPLSPIYLNPVGVTRISGCTDPNDCCYQQQFTATGNLPPSDLTSDGNFYDMDTSIECTQFPVYIGANDTAAYYVFNPYCVYQIDIQPPPAPGGGLCLDRQYVFTAYTQRYFPSDSLFGAQRGDCAFSEPQYLRCNASLEIIIPRIGFEPLDIQQLPGKCSNPGTQVTFTFQYNTPFCSGPLGTTNPLPECDVVVCFAMQPGNQATADNVLNFPAQYFTWTQPYPISNVDTFLTLGWTYNAPNTFTVPDSFLDAGAPNTTTAVPKGTWEAIIYVRRNGLPCYDGGFTADTAIAADPLDYAVATFSASQGNAEGLFVSRTALSRPQCLPRSCIAQANCPPITVTILITDVAWRGAYNVSLLDPYGTQIAFVRITYVDYCQNGPTYNMSNPIPNIYTGETIPFCSSSQVFPNTCCDIGMSQKGATVVFTIPTPTVIDNRGYTGYTFDVTAEQSNCSTLYTEFINQFLVLNTSLSCTNNLCSNTNGGTATQYTSGGTPNSFPKPFLQGPGGELIPLSYGYQWLYNGQNINVSQPFLVRLAEGNYTLIATDANGCTVEESCLVGTTYQAVELTLVSNTPANCSLGSGDAVFHMTGTSPFLLLRLSNNAQMASSNSAIITVSDLQAGINDTIIGIDANGCASPPINFAVTTANDFRPIAVVTRHPCRVGEASGIVTVSSIPGSSAVIYQFVNSGALRLVATDAACLDGPLSTDCTFANLPVGTYRVDVSNAVINCQKSLQVAVIAYTPIAIIQIRENSTAFPGTDKVTGYIFSNNQLLPTATPAYLFSLLDLADANPAPRTPVFQFVDSKTAIFVVDRIPSAAFFRVGLEDAGGCVGVSDVSNGRTSTIHDINGPTPSPPLEERLRQAPPVDITLTVVAVVVGCFTALFITIVVTVWNKREFDRLQDEEKRKTR